MYDLHVHTTASDGVLSPEEVIDIAMKNRLKGIAITDHDTVTGLTIAESYVKKHKNTFEFVPGIEINTDYKDNEVHILGYFIDYNNKEFLTKLNKLKNARYERAIKMIDKLRNMGLILEFATVQKLASGGLIARPHIGQALVNKGYVFSVKEAFEKYLARGKPAYVPRAKYPPQEAINLIKKVGGVAVLAHPGLIKDKGIINEVIQMGIEGLEVLYPEHSPKEIDDFLGICQKNKLLVTGGSDFHGIGDDTTRNRLGCMGIDEKRFNKLLDYSVKKNKV